MYVEDLKNDFFEYLSGKVSRFDSIVCILTHRFILYQFEIKHRNKKSISEGIVLTYIIISREYFL